MVDYIDMPMPYIVGLPRESYKSVLRERGTGWLPADAVCFCVDSGRSFAGRDVNTGVKLPLSLAEPVLELLEHMTNVQVRME